MRKISLPLVFLAGCLAASPAFAQTADIPSRLSLADAVRLAEARNPALEAARQQVALAEADAASARRRPNPVAGLLSEGYHGSAGGPSFLDQQELSLQVGQEFELGGKRRLRAQAADASTGRSRATLGDQVRQLRLGVERAYFQLVLARFDADQARASLAEIDQVIAVNRSRYQQGEVSGGELRRLEVERLKFSDDALQAELGIRNSRAALLALIGASRLDLPIDPTETLEVSAADRAPLAKGPADAASLTGQAFAARPDMTAARKDEERAGAELGLQHALVTPNLTLSGGYKRDFGANGVIFGFSLPLPLLDRNAPGIARAEADRRLAGSQLKVTELAVSLDVQQAVNLVDISRERVTAIERDYLQKAREARDAVLAAYKAGEIQLLDYLDAQRAYREVQRSYGRALFDYRLSLCELDAAIGVTSRGSRP
jgi:cobalt-zinc-cadmium efflux system outer membrane protein